MIPRRESMVQLARLMGIEHFLERFGSPQTAEPDAEMLGGLVEEHLDAIANGLVAEAAASDDVIDRVSAQDFFEDRLKTLGELIGEENQRALAAVCAESTKDW